MLIRPHSPSGHQVVHGHEATDPEHMDFGSVRSLLEGKLHFGGKASRAATAAPSACAGGGTGERLQEAPPGTSQPGNSPPVPKIASSYAPARAHPTASATEEAKGGNEGGGSDGEDADQTSSFSTAKSFLEGTLSLGPRWLSVKKPKSTAAAPDAEPQGSKGEASSAFKPSYVVTETRGVPAGPAQPPALTGAPLDPQPRLPPSVPLTALGKLPPLAPRGLPALRIGEDAAGTSPKATPTSDCGSSRSGTAFHSLDTSPMNAPVAGGSGLLQPSARASSTGDGDEAFQTPASAASPDGDSGSFAKNKAALESSLGTIFGARRGS